MAFTDIGTARLDLFVDERLHVCRREQRQQLRIVAQPFEDFRVDGDFGVPRAGQTAVGDGEARITRRLREESRP